MFRESVATSAHILKTVNSDFGSSLISLLKAASHYPLALLLPVSLPVAIECQPTRALDVGAVIAVAWQRQ